MKSMVTIKIYSMYSDQFINLQLLLDTSWHLSSLCLACLAGSGWSYLFFIHLIIVLLNIILGKFFLTLFQIPKYSRRFPPCKSNHVQCTPCLILIEFLFLLNFVESKNLLIPLNNMLLYYNMYISPM